MKKIAFLICDSLSHLKDSDDSNCYCVRILDDHSIKVYPNPDSDRTIISSAALGRVLDVVNDASRYFDVCCFVTTYNTLPCLRILVYNK